MFKLNASVPLDAAVLTKFINLHRQEVAVHQRMQKQYLSEPPIVFQPKKEAFKPDNRLVANFARYIIDTFNGYFIGMPTKVIHTEPEVNDTIQRFWRSNDMDDVVSELAKITSLYGKGYLFAYQDEDGETRVAYNDPFDMFVIYDKKIKPSTLYGIRYDKAEGGGYEGQIYEKDQWYDFSLVGGTLVKTAPDDGFANGKLYYGRVPIIEFIENEERQSLIKPVERLINAYHKALSEKANDVEYFADAYLKVLGADLDEKTLQALRDNRIINVSGGTDLNKIIVEFLQKPDGDSTQEHLLDRLEYLIYTVSMVTNLNDNANTALPSSGEALKIKQQPMANIARVKERKFQSGLQTLFKMYFALPTNVDPVHRSGYVDLAYNWTKNVASNEKDEMEIVRGLNGIVSTETLLSQLSFVKNADEELVRILAEKLRGASPATPAE